MAFSRKALEAASDRKHHLAQRRDTGADQEEMKPDKILSRSSVQKALARFLLAARSTSTRESSRLSACWRRSQSSQMHTTATPSGYEGMVAATWDSSQTRGLQGLREL